MMLVTLAQLPIASVDLFYVTCFPTHNQLVGPKFSHI
jgi:hypothetical protein